MGLPIWRSPPPSPRPTAVNTGDAGSTRTAIRRRTSPRTSPRDSQHRWIPSTRSRREANRYSAAVARLNVEALESRPSSTSAASRATVDACLNELQEGAISLRDQYREIFESRYDVEPGPPTTQYPPTNLAAVMTEYVHSHDDSSVTEGAQSSAQLAERYSRNVRRYHIRLDRARTELYRLEAEGVPVGVQRRRLSRLQSDFDNRSYGYNDDYSRHRVDSAIPREQLGPQPMILAVPDRFTSSPQPLQEHMSSGAVRGGFASFHGPDTELPPLMATDVRTSVPVDGLVDTVDGLGDRARSVDAEEENWNTMLSTIAPDTRLPSASSSFASTAASLSFTGSNASSRAPSASSAATTITVPDDSGCDSDEVWHNIVHRINRGEEVPSEMWMHAGAPSDIARSIARTTRERL